jgi:hypothetical protein
LSYVTWICSAGHARPNLARHRREPVQDRPAGGSASAHVLAQRTGDSRSATACDRPGSHRRWRKPGGGRPAMWEAALRFDCLIGRGGEVDQVTGGPVGPRLAPARSPPALAARKYALAVRQRGQVCGRKSGTRPSGAAVRDGERLSRSRVGRSSKSRPVSASLARRTATSSTRSHTSSVG